MNNSYITDYYNSYNEDERTKSRHGSVEFTTNMKYIRAYVPQGGKILDVGAGTGVYSMALAMDGYVVIQEHKSGFDAVEIIVSDPELLDWKAVQRELGRQNYGKICG